MVRFHICLLRSDHAHWKPGGTVFWQALTKRERATGMSRLIPSTLALMAVHRQRATSRSTSPSRRAQQGLVGGVPMTTLTSPSRSAQTPSLRASLGHDALGTAGGVGQGCGFGFGGRQVEQALAEMVPRRRRERRTKMAIEEEEDEEEAAMGRVSLGLGSQFEESGEVKDTVEGSRVMRAWRCGFKASDDAGHTAPGASICFQERGFCTLNSIFFFRSIKNAYKSRRRYNEAR